MSTEPFTQMKAPKPLVLTLEPNENRPISIEGNYLYLYESELELWVSLSGGNDFFPLELGKGVKGFVGTRFEKVNFWNKYNVQTKHTVLYATNCEYVDNSLNVIQRRDGSPLSFIPPLIAEVIGTPAADDTAIKFADYDPNRAKICLWADGDAWWGIDNTLGMEDFRQIGQSIDGFTEINSKAAIYVRRAVGVSVFAKVFKF